MKISIRLTGIILGMGILLGVLTSFGQTVLPGPFRQLANSYSIWLLFSFIAGYMIRSYKQAAIAGFLIQYLAIIFYYVTSAVRFEMPFTVQGLIGLNLIWIAGGTLIGPLAAIAGVVAMKRAKYLSIAIAATTGLFFSEALYELLILKYRSEALIFTGVGIFFLIIMYSVARYSCLKTMLQTGITTVVMFIGYAYVLTALFS